MNESENDNLEQVIKEKIKEWIAAEFKGDITEVSKIITDDFTCIGPRGSLLTKEDWLQRFKDKKLQYNKLEYRDLKIRDYKNIVIISLIQNGEYKRRSFQLFSRATTIFVYKEDKWLVEYLQLSPIL